MKKIHACSIASAFPFLFFVNTAFSQSDESNAVTIKPVIVTASRVEFKDTEAPFASEVYTRDDIQLTGASSLYEFLEQHTGLQVSASYGDKASPNIDARGFGQAFGYENLVISVDGRRINNIDSANPYLGSISIQDIERIEISLGSGSVLYGDGAMSGVLNIITKATNGFTANVYSGNHGNTGGAISAGLVKDTMHLSLTSDQASAANVSQLDQLGNKDSSKSNNWHLDTGWKFENKSTLDLVASHADQDHWYPGHLTLAQWQSNPAQTPSEGTYYPGYGFSHQTISSDQWGLRYSLPITSSFTIKAVFNSESKESDFLKPYSSQASYITNQADISLQYKSSGFTSISGVQIYDGSRSQPLGLYNAQNTTAKNNKALFYHATHVWENYTFTYGLRHEEVEYSYVPVGSGALSQNNSLNSWETGVNYKLNDGTNFFSNFSHANRAPDIDMFFTSDTWPSINQVFNGFIKPMTSDNITFGVNQVNSINKLKADVFYSRLSNEIYYDPNVNSGNGADTNLNKSHKYGLEIHDNWIITPRLSGWLNYAYTIAVVDEDNATEAGALDGKSIPGVSKNSVTTGVTWKVSELTSASVSQVWRSQAYALNDLTNTYTQLQSIYRSTNLMVTQKLNDKTHAYFAVSNLFNQANGTWVSNDVIYPYDFSRMWKVGLKFSY